MAVVNSDIPPIVNNTTPNVSTPIVAPTDNFFVLVVRNRGLPSGYSAQTVIHTAFRNAPSQNTSTPDILVPFDGQYNLPVLGGTNNDQQLQYSIVTSIVSTNQGSFVAQQTPPVIIPVDAQLKEVIIQWVSSANAFSTPVSPSVPTKPVILPKIDVIAPVGTATDGISPSSFTASTTPLPPPANTLVPPTYTVNLLNPPSGTFEASGISDMFDYVPVDSGPRTIVYSMGVSSGEMAPVNYYFRNKTVSNTLLIEPSVPQFIDITPRSAEIRPLQIVSFSVSIDNSFIKNQKNTNLTGSISWTINPLSVSGPVYVKNNLPTLPVPSNPTILQQLTSSLEHIDDSSFQNIFFDLQVSNSRLFANERAYAQLFGSVGSGSLADVGSWSKNLLFNSNTIRWTSSNDSIIDVQSLNGSSVAIIKSGISGSATITATILLPPINLSFIRWAVLYNSPIALLGNAQKITNAIQFKISKDIIVL